VLQQSYLRCVKPKLNLLKHPCSLSETFGELKTGFLDRIFKHAGLSTSSLFVDLGSGVGNAVVHAALRCQCKAFGIEIRGGPSTIAQTLKEQVMVRSRIWGLQTGQVVVEQGDLTTDFAVKVMLANADLILVNNKLFG
ncbi:histone methylation DOT1, partial [Rhodocollybia butyracea]